MIPYILYIVMTLILSILFDGREETRAKRAWYGIICFFLIILVGFRNGVGGDTQCYMVDFEYIPTLASDYREYIRENFIMHSYMPGWSILNIVCKRLFDSFYAVQLIEAIIVNTCIFYIFRKYTSRIFLCALLFAFTGYLFIFNTEVMREALAISIISVGMYKYLNGKKLTFYITILIGLTFHVSAIIALLFPLLKFCKNISFTTLIYSFVGSFVLWLFSSVLMLYILNHLSGDIALLGKMISYGDKMNNIFGFLESALRYLVAQAGIMYFAQFSPTKTEQLKDHYTHYVGFFLLIAVFVCAIPGLYRFLNYTAVISIILVAEYIGSMKSQLTNLAISKCVVLLIFSFYCCKYYYKVWPNSKRHNYEFFVPYYSILDENPNTEYRYYMWQDAVNREKTQKESRGF